MNKLQKEIFEIRKEKGWTKKDNFIGFQKMLGEEFWELTQAAIFFETKNENN